VLATIRPGLTNDEPVFSISRHMFNNGGRLSYVVFYNRFESA